eukprot:GILJ01000461.1.p1 GENE.GILJ01000461.1~~GILJ01000461.1.p1  ORF type:complete len:507 (+),score=67.62 GILJ01000461.1:48-1568(+)
MAYFRVLLATCALSAVLGLPVRLPLYTDICARSLVLPVLVDGEEVCFPKLDTGAHMIALFERTTLNEECLSEFARDRFPQISKELASESDGLLSPAKSLAPVKWLAFGKSYMRVQPRTVEDLQLLPEGPVVKKKSIRSVLGEIPSDSSNVIDEIQEKLSEKSKSKETVAVVKGEKAAEFVYDNLVQGTINPSRLGHALEYTGILGFAGMTTNVKNAGKAHITSFFKEAQDTVCFAVERSEEEMEELDHVLGHLEIGSRVELIEEEEELCSAGSFPIEFGTGFKRNIRFPAKQVKVILNGEELVLCSENCQLIPDTGNPAHVHLSQEQFDKYWSWNSELKKKAQEEDSYNTDYDWTKVSMQFDLEGGHSLTWTAAEDILDISGFKKRGECSYAGLSPLESWKDDHFLLPLSFFADRKICLTYDVEKRVPATLDILQPCKQSNTATDEEDAHDVEGTLDQEEATQTLTLTCDVDFQALCKDSCSCGKGSPSLSCVDDTCTEFCSCVSV